MVASRKIRILHYGVRNCQGADLTHFFDYFGESGRIGGGDTSQDFAVEDDIFGFEDVDKAAIG